jgi:hypothetical protein
MKNMRLYYYKNEKKTDQSNGVINFDLVNCKVKFNDKKHRFYLHLKGVSRVFKLRAMNSVDFNMWTYKMMKNIEKSKGRRFDLGMDEKKLAVDSWRVNYYHLLLNCFCSTIKLMKRHS